MLKSRNNNFLIVLEWYVLFAFLVLFIVWPLRGTIAARNISLITGACASIIWFWYIRPRVNLKGLLPTLFLLCVPVWLLGLYYLNPIVPDLQWDDLRGTWLRVLVGCIFAAGLGHIFRARPEFGKFLIGILFIWPIVLFLSFMNEIFFAHTGDEFFIEIFKSKIACVYFLMWSLAFLFSVAHYLLLRYKLSTSPDKKYIYSVCALLPICIVDLFALKSLNGFLTIFFAMVLLIIFLLKQYNYHASVTQGLYAFSVLTILTIGFVFAVLHFDTKYSQGKLNNLASDVHFILNEDTSGAWKWDGSNDGRYPLNPSTNQVVHGSTYERVAWYRQGLKFLNEHPFGLGYTSRAFMHYMSEQFTGSRATKTHSGWLDFSLGAGVVGLLCIWAAMGLIAIRVWRLISQKDPVRLVIFYVFWCLLMMFILWHIGELSEREFIESFFFSIVFFSVVTEEDIDKDGMNHTFFIK